MDLQVSQRADTSRQHWTNTPLLCWCWMEYRVILNMCFKIDVHVCPCVCVCARACVCPMEVRRGLDRLELKLQVVVSCLMWVLDTELGSPTRVASALNAWTPLPPPLNVYLLVCPWVLNILTVLIPTWPEGRQEGFSKMTRKLTFQLFIKIGRQKDKQTAVDISGTLGQSPEGWQCGCYQQNH